MHRQRGQSWILPSFTDTQELMCPTFESLLFRYVRNLRTQFKCYSTPGWGVWAEMGRVVKAKVGWPLLITVFRVRVSSHLFLYAFASIPRMLVCLYICMFVYLCLFVYCQRFQIKKESFDDTVCLLSTLLFCTCVQRY